MMALTAQEILSRMQQGERLRWVPPSMLGESGIGRRLILGSQRLVGDAAYMVAEMDGGLIISTECQSGICDYSLNEGQPL